MNGLLLESQCSSTSKNIVSKLLPRQKCHFFQSETTRFEKIEVKSRIVRKLENFIIYIEKIWDILVFTYSIIDRDLKLNICTKIIKPKTRFGN